MAPRHWPPPSNQLGQKLNPVSLYRVYMGSRSCECDVAHADWVPPVRPMFQSPCWRRPLEREGQPLHVLVISPINLSTLKSRFALDCTTSPKCGVVTYAWLPYIHKKYEKERSLALNSPPLKFQRHH